MPSLVPGYAYDIFISYRQKDNKYDGWVTEFVSNLRKELEATFKEDISIYFDENPHDGLLETHDVDESLKDKLKCLIFIPIISQTYCDPKSFAWSNEFLVFKNLVSDDEFGLKIRLSNGNVANRILPVRIHDLDHSDKSLLEGEIGPLRSIDFIFKSPGVNRPLNVSDKREDNVSKIFYRDQVNKVANAIKEIIINLKQSKNEVASVSDFHQPKISNKKYLNQKSYAVFAVVLTILFVGWYFLNDSLNDEESATELSIAVLPFKNLSVEPGQLYFSDGLTEDITDRLTKIRSLRVITPSTIVQYVESDKKTVSQVAQELDVNFLLEGSAARLGDKVKVVARLVEVKSTSQLWSTTIEKEGNDILEIQGMIATQLARYLELSLSKNEQGEIRKIPTRSIEAYDINLKARSLLEQREPDKIDEAIRFYQKVVKLDPQFVAVFGGLSSCYSNKYAFDHNSQWLDSAFYYAKKAIAIDLHNPIGYWYLANAYSASGDRKSAYTYHLKALKLKPGPGYFGAVAGHMAEFHKMDSAIYYNSQIYLLHDLGPTNFRLAWRNRARFYMELGLYDSAEHYLEKSYLIDPKHVDFKIPKAEFHMLKKEYDKVIQYIKTDILIYAQQPDVLGEALNLLAKAYAFKNDWSTLRSFLVEHNLDKEPLMALALLRTNQQASIKVIIEAKIHEYTISNNRIGMAQLSILEGNLAKGSTYYQEGYHQFQCWSKDILMDPFYVALMENPDFREFMKGIEMEHSMAVGNIKKMYDQ